ncbi:hypothetical protein IW261DRAFT_1425793 [Armillaria novae-zelandiae]|uniref:Uncharacterized protein n=1 Tax=Armillaria novae-zelandiae TaxID=153914 RepID=A0AA39NRY8_9AGAR|nr:hypothetical protein IW261DRAFT_1425793 [Armillaria novae-zelandiae]
MNNDEASETYPRAHVATEGAQRFSSRTPAYKADVIHILTAPFLFSLGVGLTFLWGALVFQMKIAERTNAASDTNPGHRPLNEEELSQRPVFRAITVIQMNIMYRY